MVKIINTFGDVKTGVQGDAVYQTHYGQQMRRVKREKRGDVSKPQKSRRRLFSQALDWRANLDRHDRRYLEGLAYHRHIRDSQGIILSWDKVALKIALEVPTIAVVD
jgi:hypothetical protein